jgi:hypothetical protein
MQGISTFFRMKTGMIDPSKQKHLSPKSSRRESCRTPKGQDIVSFGKLSPGRPHNQEHKIGNVVQNKIMTQFEQSLKESMAKAAMKHLQHLNEDKADKSEPKSNSTSSKAAKARRKISQSFRLKANS